MSGWACVGGAIQKGANEALIAARPDLLPPHENQRIEKWFRLQLAYLVCVRDLGEDGECERPKALVIAPNAMYSRQAPLHAVFSAKPRLC